MSRKKGCRRERKRGSRKTLAWGLFWFFLFILLCYGVYSFSHPSNVSVSQASGFKAAIVDQLSLSQPNQTFVQTATNILETAGFTVDYYKGEEVTVEFYKSLPTHYYGLIILRVHSALRVDSEPSVGLFTSEPYSKTKYLYEQLTEQVVRANFYEEGELKEPSYFGIQPGFVKQSMKEKFQRTIIIMMGCNGLTYPCMAEAFIEKGASVYISWTDSVLASHTDLATTRLLHHFVTQKRNLKEAVKETFREVGLDPSYGSLLLYYPLEAGKSTIQNVVGDLNPKH